MSYGVDWADLMRRAGTYADKIFRGAKPSDLPIEQPTKFELVINLKTARALGLAIPPSLPLPADQVIEVNRRAFLYGRITMALPALVAELFARGRQSRTPPFPGLSSRSVIWLEATIAVDVSYGRIMQGWLREPACRGLAAAN